MHTKKTTTASVMESAESLWSLDSETLLRLLDAVRGAPPEELERIAAVVESATARQDALLTKLVKADPGFPGKLRQFLHDKLAGVRGRVEGKEIQDIADIVQKIDES